MDLSPKRMANTLTAEASPNPSFHLESHGDIAVMIPSPEVERMDANRIQQASQGVLPPLRQDPPAGLVIDLSQVNSFGSDFLSFLVHCHNLVKNHGTAVVVAGPSERARELLHLTNLDTLWAIYNTQTEAVTSLAGSEETRRVIF